MVGIRNDCSYSLNEDAITALVDLLQELGCDTYWLEGEEAVSIPDSVVGEYVRALSKVIPTLQVVSTHDPSFINDQRLAFYLPGTALPTGFGDSRPLADYPEDEKWLTGFIKFASKAHAFTIG
jgi:hypothetical protein